MYIAHMIDRIDSSDKSCDACPFFNPGEPDELMSGVPYCNYPDVVKGIQPDPRPTAYKSYEYPMRERYSIIRADRSGVFFGKVTGRADGGWVVEDCRRIWYWSGAASISELASKGVSRPDECRFPAAVGNQIIYDVIEIIPCTDKAVESIKAVTPWSEFDE